MTSQVQGKGKKKNKDVMKVSLEEFNQIDAPVGHSVVNLKVTGLDWAETMADYDQQSAEVQQIIVPAAPRAQRGPGIDFDKLPTEPPFRVSLYNVPVAAEEKDITDKFFKNIEVLNLNIEKTTTTVDLGSRQDLYEALGKDGVSMKGRTINVCLYGEAPPTNNYGRAPQNNYGQNNYGQNNYGQNNYGQPPQNNYGRAPSHNYGQAPPNNYGGRSSNSSYGESSYQAGARSDGGGWRSNYNRDRDNTGGYNRFNAKPMPAAPVESRPKLVLHKRKTPLDVDDVSNVARNEAIFGKAKPSSTPYQKMNEIEEKLKAVQIAPQKPRSRHVSGENKE